MNILKEYEFDSLYEMSSGISSTKDQAGHGAPFVSFGTVFNNYFLPDNLSDLMDTSVEEQETYSVKKGDILVTRTSETIDELAMSCVALKDYPCATYSGFTKRLRPMQSDVSYDKYMAFYLRSEWFRKVITNNAFMTLRASFNEDIFSFLKIYLPDYDQQVKIGDFLYCIEKKIQKNKEADEKLEEIAKLIFEYWCVQYDFPNTEGKPYKASSGKMRTGKLIGEELPDDWEEGTLASIITIETDTVNPSQYGSELMEHYSIPAFDSRKYPAYEEASTIESNKYAVVKDSILVSKLNPQFKRIWNPYCETDKAVCSTEFLVCVPKKSKYRAFCYGVLNSEKYSAFMVTNAISSTGSRKRIQPDVCLTYKLAIPNEDVIDSFNAVYEPIIEKQRQLRKENARLEKLRDWLIPIFMNGQASMR